MTDSTLTWSIAGTGGIAAVFAQCIQASNSGTVGNVISRTMASAEAFCATHGGTPTVDATAALRNADAVYVATPHPMHKAMAIEALRAGVPVLCEKPMTSTGADTLEVVQAARDFGTPLVEAWMYRCHPQIAEAVAMLQSGAIGHVTHVHSTFGFAADVPKAHRLRNPELGGGAILDIGGYVMSSAMLFGAEMGQNDVPSLLEAHGTFDATGVDAEAAAVVAFDSGVQATLQVSIINALGTEVRIEGTEGVLELPCPFLPESRRQGVRGTLVLNGEPRHLVADMDCFSLEARAMAACVASGTIEPAWPLLSHEASVTLANTLDAWSGALESSA